MKARNYICAAVTSTILCCATSAYAIEEQQFAISDPELDAFLTTDIANLTVTSVSRRPQKLGSIPSAVYVVTKEDIHRTGATSVGEVLRIVPGLQVAQVASNKWAIGARGFNGTTTNKLLVMIDGRSVYTPVFSGTYWDDRNIPVTEVERIEVIRGPGASVWGANALNGIIHIITKSGKDETGNYIDLAAGNEEQSLTAGRAMEYDHGRYYRTYAQIHNYDSSELSTGGNAADSWYRGQAGFRLDGDDYMLSTHAYGGEQENHQTVRQRTAPFFQTYDSHDSSLGASIVGSQDFRFSSTSNGTFRAYLDHYERAEEIANQTVSTLDLDWQHDIQTSDRNNFIWGAGYRFSAVAFGPSFGARVTQEERNYSLLSAFLQNEYALLPDELFLTLGSKFELNDLTGFEAQPNARLSWVIDDSQTVWGAVSRAVRTPSVIEDDINLVFNTSPGPTYDVAFGVGSVSAERLIAYELGYRVAPTDNLQIDSTVYYNDYSNLVTVTPGAPFFTGITFVNPYYVSNDGSGHVYGFETAVTYNTSSSHKLMGSYTFAEIDTESHNGALSNNGTENTMPKHSFALRSYWNITPEVQFDNMLYFVSALGNTRVDEYARYDTRLAWQVDPALELSLTGRNLLEESHPEFSSSTYQTEVERSFIGRATWRF